MNDFTSLSARRPKTSYRKGPRSLHLESLADRILLAGDLAQGEALHSWSHQDAIPAAEAGTLLDDRGIAVDIDPDDVAPLPTNEGRIYLDDGVLVIEGDDGADSVTVRQISAGKLHWIEVAADFSTGSFGTETEHVVFRVARSLVQEIQFFGNGGSDQFVNETSIRCYAAGGSGDDDLQGGTGADELHGGDGNDTIAGGGNADVIYGGEGDDLIRGLAGDDTIYGESGADELRGGDGSDTIEGGDDDDVLYGGNGADVLRGGIGDDTIYGEIGADEMRGGDGHDTMYGCDGDDTIYGGDGSDIIGGGKGNDDINGGSRDDVIYGGDGDDLIRGLAGDDTIDGGNGADTLYGGGGQDVIRGKDGNDAIYGGGGDDLLNGGGDHDVIGGGAGEDEIYGVAGDDSIDGGAADDEIYGGSGNDTLYGGEGDDEIFGGAGDDRLFGEDGEDTLKGEGNDDVLEGGADGDFLYGHGGDDELHGGGGEDYLHGGGGDDVLYGDNGDDDLHGGNGDDSLYGGSNSDRLFGDDGNDGLFGGGSSEDLLNGGAGADRFLMQDEDEEEDYKSSEDAKIKFKDAAASHRYGGDRWSEEEIIWVDEALQVLHDYGGDNMALLKPRGLESWTWKKNYTFKRVDDIPEASAEAWTFGTITFDDDAFRTRTKAHETVFHEIGHEWGNYGSGLWWWTSWLSLSAWRLNGPERTDPDDVLSGDRCWLYDADAEEHFVSAYAKRNPLEDFAESFMAYFMNYAADIGYEAFADDGDGGASNIDEPGGKLEFIESVLECHM